LLVCPTPAQLLGRLLAALVRARSAVDDHTQHTSNPRAQSTPSHQTTSQITPSQARRCHPARPISRANKQPARATHTPKHAFLSTSNHHSNQSLTHPSPPSCAQARPIDHTRDIAPRSLQVRCTCSQQRVPPRLACSPARDPCPPPPLSSRSPSLACLTPPLLLGRRSAALVRARSPVDDHTSNPRAQTRLAPPLTHAPVAATVPSGPALRSCTRLRSLFPSGEVRTATGSHPLSLRSPTRHHCLPPPLSSRRGRRRLLASYRRCCSAESWPLSFGERALWSIVTPNKPATHAAKHVFPLHSLTHPPQPPAGPTRRSFKGIDLPFTSGTHSQQGSPPLARLARLSPRHPCLAVLTPRTSSTAGCSVVCVPHTAATSLSTLGSSGERCALQSMITPTIHVAHAPRAQGLDGGTSYQPSPRVHQTVRSRPGVPARPGKE
jgi:hypothetical protein